MKAKRLLLSLLSVICLGISAVAVTSCEEEHVHEWNEIERIDATCTEYGIIKYVCLDCGEVKEVIPEEAKGHNYVNYTCDRCGEYEVFEYTEGLSFMLNNDNSFHVSIGTAKDSNIIVPAAYKGKPVTTMSFAYGSFESITIPDSVTSIDHSAFYGCSSLTSITIPDSVTSINHNAFYGCSSLTSITIPDSVTSIGGSVFSGCNSLTSIVVDINNRVFDSRNNCNAIIKTSTNTLIAACKTTVIPDSVTSISGGAFSGCSSLTSITIPDSITIIDEQVFAGCSSLTSITIPDSVTSIGWMSFEGCSSLTSITIPDSVTSIDAGAFSGCSSLTSITIPDSVTSIDVGAFIDCLSLYNVYYTGTEEQWNDISIDMFNEYLTSANITYNYK